ncbi:MAG: hypothetical protein Q4C96_10505 [Planctomycetia bacterium]|nr:hypothetical protein [Planctomycetia bacterium]
MNFFDWIRQGVKRSVLEGVADAVNHMGTPVEQDKIREHLLNYVTPDNQVSGVIEADSAKRPVLRKRLGRGITLDSVNKEE